MFLKRASSEYCIASVVRYHPHIVGALDLLMEDYHFCMVMALTEMGNPLSRSSTPTMTLLTQLTDAIAYLHSLGIAHCNIQPSTILVFPGGIVKLTGFGDAHVFCPPFQTTHIPLSTTKTIGLLAYQAPEVLCAWNHAHTHTLAATAAAAPVDMWALGIVVYAHAQEGRLPWSVACPRHDTQYAKFQTYPPPVSLLHHLLDPNPVTRINSQQLFTYLSSHHIPSLFSILD
jgi:protein-serine/threonine kinase